MKNRRLGIRSANDSLMKRTFKAVKKEKQLFFFLLMEEIQSILSFGNYVKILINLTDSILFWKRSFKQYVL